MTKEQEAQQAQTIAEIRNRNAQRGAWIEDCRLSDESSEQACYDCNDLLEIVDSQAQKVEELENENDKRTKAFEDIIAIFKTTIAGLEKNIAANSAFERQIQNKIDWQENEIADQAKEITELKSKLFEAIRVGSELHAQHINSIKDISDTEGFHGKDPRDAW